MPVSSYVGKKEMLKYIMDKVGDMDRIMDVGCGIGTYHDILRPLGYKYIDGIEVYQPYIEKYNLHSKYDNVYNMNVLDFISWYNYKCVILGDVLEHLSEENARILLNTLFNNGVNHIIISVPYNNIQGEYKGNKYETHLQPELNPERFKQLYPEFTCIAEGKHRDNPVEHIGAWVWSR